MTEEVTVIEEHTELAIPGTGEIVSLDNPEQCALALDALRQHELVVREAKSILTRAIVEESQRRGTKTLALAGDRAARVSMRKEIVWDFDELAKLRDAGLPEDRWNALVKETVEQRVDGREARQIASANPEYAAIIDRARQEFEGRPSVSIGRA